ncbi:MAG: hypothetical protein U5J98_06090 [Halobacteriales archaeon]|nr:hypothetical protein [Halobacteriales archaeon]
MSSRTDSIERRLVDLLGVVDVHLREVVEEVPDGEVVLVGAVDEPVEQVVAGAVGQPVQPGLADRIDGVVLDPERFAVEAVTGSLVGPGVLHRLEVGELLEGLVEQLLEVETRRHGPAAALVEDEVVLLDAVLEQPLELLEVPGVLGVAVDPGPPRRGVRPALVHPEVEHRRAVDGRGGRRVGEQHALVVPVDGHLVAVEVERQPVDGGLGDGLAKQAQLVELVVEGIEVHGRGVVERVDGPLEGAVPDPGAELPEPRDLGPVEGVQALLVVLDVDVRAEALEDRPDVRDACSAPRVRGPEQPEERPVVGLVGEARAAVEGDLRGLEGGLDERGVLARPVEHDRHPVGVLGGHAVEDGVDDGGRRVEQAERRQVERLVGERIDDVVLIGQDRPLERGELLEADDRDVLVRVDLVAGQPARRRVEVAHDLEHGLRGRRRVGVVLQDGVQLALVVPALEDVPDGVGRLLPRQLGLLDHLEEGDAVLGGLPAARGEPARRDRERPEVGVVEPAVDGARQRGVGDEDEVVAGDLVVEFVNRFRPVDRHGLPRFVRW